LPLQHHHPSYVLVVRRLVESPTCDGGWRKEATCPFAQVVAPISQFYERGGGGGG